jgi:transcriptional regulator with XRE-family HTH domain
MSSQFVPAVGSRRRVQALVAIGYTYEEIAAGSGVGKGAIYKIANGVNEKLAPETADKVAAGFDALSTVPGTSQRSIKLAREQNWYPAGMWDDIDDENEVVDCPVDPDDVDEILVELFIKGEKTLYQLNAAEKNDAEQQMLAKGWDPEHVANRLHRTWTRETELRAAA